MIEASYTLLTRVPLYQSTDGLYADDLWAKDLGAHINYIRNFTICCPVEQVYGASVSLKRINGLTQSRVIKLRTDHGWGSAIANFLPNLFQVAIAVRKSKIIHTTCAGWAFPLAYYILLLRPLFRFKWINVVESSFWIKPKSGHVSLRQNTSHYLNEFLVRRCVRASDARIFTQDWYRTHYLGSDDAALVNTAVWIDDANFRSVNDLKSAQTEGTPTSLIFPARLTSEKGVDTVIAAVKEWDARYDGFPGPPLQIDIIGEGPLAERCRQFISKRKFNGRLHMRFLESVAYGPGFFDLLRNYSAAIVANRQAEQARIVFDAMAQGLAIFASDTSGNRAVVKDGDTGVFVPVDDPLALAKLFDRASREKEWLYRMGGNALSAAQGFSHSAMHIEREKFLHRMLDLPVCK